MKCPQCEGTELRRDAEARWDAEKGAWTMIDEDWLMGSFIWCAECETEFNPPRRKEKEQAK
jgi:hypothetical protein